MTADGTAAAAPGMVRVGAAEMEQRATAFLVAHGSPEWSARVQAAHLVEAELRGHPSHGLRRLIVLAGRIDSGLIDPGAEPQLEWVASAALRVDGRRGFGPVAAHRAIDAVIERLPQTGTVAVSLHRTHHLGMLAPYVERLAEAGAVGIVLSSTEGLVHPWGGAGALVGTNPIGIGVPADGGDVVVDMSTGAVSAGKILDYRAKGMPLPDGWAVDAAGRPTTDAAAAAEGAISPFGGAKGYALGLAFGAAVGAVSGTAFGPDVHGTLDTEHETTKGDVIIALDAGLLAGADTRAALGGYLGLLRASGTDGRVAIPGDRARAERSRRLEDGVEIATDIWQVLGAEPDEPSRIAL